METYIPDDFEDRYGDELRDWCSREFPRLDFDQTLIRFREKADAGGSEKWKARKWSAKFKVIIRNGIERGYQGIVVYKGGREHDPKWTSILARTGKTDFGPPSASESPQGYATRFEQWLRSQPAPFDVSRVLKLVSK